jgi:hypothetical protein
MYVDPLYQISSESMRLFRELKQAYEMTDVTSPLRAHFPQFLLRAKNNKVMHNSIKFF